MDRKRGPRPPGGGARGALRLCVLFGGVGPIAFVPGGALWGETREPPEDWSFTDGIKEIQVQTHVEPLPWSVTTWVLSSEGELFLAAGNCDRVWTHRVMDDPEIRLRIDGIVCEIQARRETNRGHRGSTRARGAREVHGYRCRLGELEQ